MFSNSLLRDARRCGYFATYFRRTFAIWFGVVGTLSQPAGKVSVIPPPETRSAPDGACKDDETGVLSCRLSHRFMAVWARPHPNASPTKAAATRTTGFLLARAKPPGAGRTPSGLGASWRPSGPGVSGSADVAAVDFELRSVIAVAPLCALRLGHPH